MSTHPEPKISPDDARAICATQWPTEAAARAQGALLADAGWHISWRWPAVPFGDTGRKVVASVHHPSTYASPGDVTFRSEASDHGPQVVA